MKTYKRCEIMSAITIEDLNEIERAILVLIHKNEGKAIAREEIDYRLLDEAEEHYSYSTPKFKGFGSYRVMLPGPNRPNISWDDLANTDESINHLASLKLLDSKVEDGIIMYQLTDQGAQLCSDYLATL